MKRRKTIQGGVEGFAGQRSSDASSEDMIAPHTLSEKSLSELRDNAADEMFTMCARVDSAFVMPETTTLPVGYHNVSNVLGDYECSTRTLADSPYGLIHYDISDDHVVDFQSLSFILLGTGITHERLSEAVASNSQTHAPGGLLALHELMHNDGFKKMREGVYVFPGFVVFNGNGTWCVLEVNIKMLDRKKKVRKAVPYLVPLDNFTARNRYIVLQKK